MSAPAVRVNWTRLVLKTLANWGSQTKGRVLDRLPAQSRAAIDGAGPIAWLDLEHHRLVCEAIRDVLGDPDYRAHFCDATVHSGRMPLFRPLVQGFLRLFGPTPASTVRAAPRAWSHIFRDLGRFGVGEEGDRTIDAEVVSLHPALRRTETFALGVQGAFDACMEFVDYDGGTKLDTSEIDAGVLRYHVHWTAPRKK